MRMLRRAQQRAIRTVGDMRQLSYFSMVDSRMMDRVRQFPIFANGRNLRGRDLLQGRLHRQEVFLCMSLVTFGSGRNRHTIKRLIVVYPEMAILCDDFHLRDLTLARRFWHWLTGSSSIVFPSSLCHDTFKKQYELTGQNEDSIPSVFTERVREFLAANPGWNIEFEQATLLLTYQETLRLNNLFTYGHTPRCDEVATFLDNSCKIASLLRGA